MQATEEIKSRLSIVDVVASYVKLEKSGIHWKAPCPFHQERTPSFMVNEERGMWHCFGCNRGGDVFAFVMEMDSLSFREALEILATRAGVELPAYSGQDSQGAKDKKQRLRDALELATKFYEKQLWEGVGKQRVLPYLYERGLTDESIQRFRLGYAPDGWSHLTEFLQGKGFTHEEIEEAGLSLRKAHTRSGERSHYDRFRDRIMFPIEDTFAKVIGYSARVAPGGDESQAKYINTPETPLYYKSTVLYGISQAKTGIKSLGEAIVVEGNMDVIALHQAGFTNAVAVSGTALTAEQLRVIKRYTRKLKLFFDMDAAGQKAARKSTELALQHDFQTALVTLPQGKDAADLAKENQALLEQSLKTAKDAPAAILERLVTLHDSKSAEGKRAVVEDFGELISHIQHPVEQEHWISVLAREIQSEERALRAGLQKIFQAKSQKPVSDEEKKEISITSSRAESLRAEYIRLLLALPGAWEKESHHVSSDVQEYLLKHPLFFFILQAKQEDPMSLIEDPQIKQRAAEELFRLFETEEGLREANPTERRQTQLVQIREELIQELEGKEKLRSLEQALRTAKEQGDRDTEQKLLEEFVRLSSRLTQK